MKVKNFSIVYENPLPQLRSRQAAFPFLAEDDNDFNSDPMSRQETIELVRAYYKIPNRKAAKYLYDLIITMSKSAYNSEEEKE